MNNRIIKKNAPEFFQPAKDVTCDSPEYTNLGNLSVLPVDMINEIINNMTLETAYELYSSNSVLQRIMNNIDPLNACLMEYQQILKAIDALHGELNEISSSKPGYFQMLRLSFTDKKNRYNDKWWHVIKEEEEYDAESDGWGTTNDDINPYGLSALILIAGLLIPVTILGSVGLIALVAITTAIIVIAALPIILSRISKVNEMYNDQEKHDNYKHRDIEKSKNPLMHSFFSLGTTPVKNLNSKIMDEPLASRQQH